MNRRDLVRSGIVAAGVMALPMRKAFAFQAPRSTTVMRGLEAATGKAYADITPLDLERVFSLPLPHIHIDSFEVADFSGLTNLRDVSFRSVFHSVPALPVTVFEGLEGLEELNLEANQFATLPDEVFAPLANNLLILNLRLTNFDNLPSSIFGFTQLTEIRASAMDAGQRQQLVDHYGAIVVD